MIQRVIVSNYDEYGDPVEGVGIDSNSVLAIDVQSHLQTTIQTHNAVSIATQTASVQTSWIDCDGFDKVAITLLNDAALSARVDVYWSNDGSTQHGYETAIVASSTQQKAGIIDTKARYLKLAPVNLDAASHTMSAWAYLKA